MLTLTSSAQENGNRNASQPFSAGVPPREQEDRVRRPAFPTRPDNTKLRHFVEPDKTRCDAGHVDGHRKDRCAKTSNNGRSPTAQGSLGHSGSNQGSNRTSGSRHQPGHWREGQNFDAYRHAQEGQGLSNLHCISLGPCFRVMNDNFPIQVTPSAGSVLGTAWHRNDHYSCS